MLLVWPATVNFGQLRTYTDDQRRAAVPHNLPFTLSTLYSHFRPNSDLQLKTKTATEAAVSIDAALMVTLLYV